MQGISGLPLAELTHPVVASPTSLSMPRHKEGKKNENENCSSPLYRLR
jgi:hypothetical protein